MSDEMASINANVEKVLLNLELVSTSKRIAEPFEEGFQWMSRSYAYVSPEETVATLVFAGKGKRRVLHLKWSEVVRLHQTYVRLDQIEKHLREQMSVLEPKSAS